MFRMVPFLNMRLAKDGSLKWPIVSPPHPPPPPLLPLFFGCLIFCSCYLIGRNISFNIIFIVYYISRVDSPLFPDPPHLCANNLPPTHVRRQGLQLILVRSTYIWITHNSSQKNKQSYHSLHTIFFGALPSWFRDYAELIKATTFRKSGISI